MSEFNAVVASIFTLASQTFARYPEWVLPIADRAP